MPGKPAVRIHVVYVLQDVLGRPVNRDVFAWPIDRHSVRSTAATEDVSKAPAIHSLPPALISVSPQIHHSDRGIQYASEAFRRLLDKHRVAGRMSAKERAVKVKGANEINSRGPRVAWEECCLCRLAT